MFEPIDQIFETVTSPRTIWIVLWSGLAALTIALLVVTRTKWGQARPMSKCVVLSVFAHLLMLGYAYKTELFAIYPSDVADKSIQVTIISSDFVPQSDVSQRKKLQPWERFSDPVPLSIRQPSVERSQITEKIDDDPRTTEDVNFDTGMPKQNNSWKSHNLETLKPPPSVLADTGRDVAGAAPIKNIQRTRHSQSVEKTPDARSPTRRDVPLTVIDTNRQAKVPTIPTRKSDISTQVEHLAEIPNVPAPAEIQAGDEESSTDVVSRSDITIDDLNIPAGGSPFGADASRQASSPVAATPITAVDGSGAPLATDADRDPIESHVVEQKTVEKSSGALPDVYRPRLKKNRIKILQRGGGNVITEAAVESGLRWLAVHQNQDGSWNADRFGAGRETQVFGHNRNGAGANADSGVTGLALLAMLGTGNTHYRGKYRKNIQHGLEYLLSYERNGNLAGDARTYAMMYCHGIALFAVCEAYAMTGDKRMEPYVQRAVDYSIQAQNSLGGGWRYQPGDEGDMSIFGWQLMALKSADLAGLAVPERTRKGMRRFLQRCSSGEHGGLAAYRPHERPTRTMTAEALLCHLVLGADGEESKIQEAQQYLIEQLPGDGRVNLYYWYYATLALYGLGGDAWQQWNTALQRELIDRQRNDGVMAGSWDPNSVWGGYGGRVYSTSMATMCLEVYYRYLPPTLDLRQVHTDKNQKESKIQR